MFSSMKNLSKFLLFSFFDSILYPSSDLNETLSRILIHLIKHHGFNGMSIISRRFYSIFSLDYDPQCLDILRMVVIDFYHDLLIRFKEYSETIGSPMTFHVRPIRFYSIQIFGRFFSFQIGCIRTNTRRGFVHQSCRTFSFYEIHVIFSISDKRSKQQSLLTNISYLFLSIFF